jgi:hypothetical protein
MIETTREDEGGWLGQLRATVKRHPRQAWVLVVLLFVMAALWAKVLISGRLPSIAAAEQATVAAASAEISDETADHATHRLTLTQWAQQPTDPIKRNLFAVPIESYPIDPSHPPPSDSSAKSPSSSADQNRERQVLEAQAEAAAAHLNLEGIVLGAAPRAWINGVLVGLNQSVSDTGFTVVKIEARRIIIQRDGVQVELSMAK